MKGKHVPGKTPAIAEEIALLYGVAKTTVYRWYEADAFEVMPQVLPSPSGTRDRLLFDREAIAKQFEAEMLDPKDVIPEETRAHRRAALEAFLNG